MLFSDPLSTSLAYRLDQIADAYVPLLLLIALVDVVLRWRNGDKLHCLKLLYAVVVVYGWMFIDNYFQLWPSVGLDYSTHSAAGFALAVVIGLGKRRAYQYALAISLIAYGALMHLLSYHTGSDMVSTLGVVAGCLLPLFLKLQSRQLQSLSPQA